MPETKVSVILHHDKDNDANFADTLKSIYTQTYSDIEVLIISD